MPRLGTVTLQSLDSSDIFLKEDVHLDGNADYYETVMDIPNEDPGFELDQAWLTGNVPAPIPIIVEGDSTMIIGWFKSDGMYPPFDLKIYIEYEEAEDIVIEEGNKDGNEEGHDRTIYM